MGDRTPPGGWRRWLPDAAVALVSAALLATLVGPTLEQTVWWDEAEYLIRGRHLALGTPQTGYFDGRPPLLGLVVGAFYAVGLGEGALKAAMLLCLWSTVLLTHRIGRILIGPHAAVVGALLFCVFYVPVFYGARILTDVPQLALLLVALLLALDRRPGVAILFLPVFVLAGAMRFSAVVLLPTLAAAYLGTHGLAVLRHRNARAALGLGGAAVLAYGAWSYSRGGAVAKLVDAWGFLLRVKPRAAIRGFEQQAEFLTDAVGWPLLALCALGLLGLAARAWQRRREAPLLSSAGLLLLAWVGLSLLFFGGVIKRNPAADRYLVGAMPAVFLAMGAVVDLAQDYLPQRRRALAAIGTGLILFYAVPTFHTTTRQTVLKGAMGFGGIQEAGEWIRANSEPDDVVFGLSVPQLTYYSERAVYPTPNKPRRYGELLGEHRPRFIVLTTAHSPPRWFMRIKQESLGYRIAFKTMVRGDGAVVYVHDGNWSR